MKLIHTALSLVADLDRRELTEDSEETEDSDDSEEKYIPLTLLNPLNPLILISRSACA